MSIHWSFGQRELLGSWEGQLTVEQENKVVSNYKIVLYIEQNGEQLEGGTWLIYGDYKANIAFKGVYDDRTNILTLEDTKTIEADTLPNGGEWCKKIMSLHYFNQRKSELIEGNWRGNTSFSTCTPGKIILKRVKDRA